MNISDLTFPKPYEDYFDEHITPYDEHIIPYDNQIEAPYLTYNNIYFNEIRLSIFHIVAACVGLPCLIWAFYSVHCQRKASGRISAFIILLLLSDLLQLLLYPYIVSNLLFTHLFFPPELLIIFASLKITGLLLQPLVALEATLTLKCPVISAQIFSCPCYIMISIIILLIPVMCSLGLFVSGPRHDHMCEYLTFGSCLLPACLSVATGIIIYKAPPTAASTPDSRRGAMVFTVSLVTLLVLYLPCVLIFALCLLDYCYLSWLKMMFCLLSLTVISEPLLCVLVCRQNLSAQTKQTRIELNTEQTSV